MSNKNYYDVLGVDRSASDADIKKTFRQLAKKFHPDVNKDEGAEAKFKEISEAYNILSDPDKRSKYDNPQQFRSAFDPEEFFRGFGFQAGLRNRGFDIEIQYKISFLDSVKNTERIVTIPKIDLCDSCKGKGHTVNDSYCSSCAGRGRVSHTQSNMTFTTDCNSCLGSGKNITECHTCSSTGGIENSQQINLKIPAGIFTGHKLRVAGHGGPDANSGNRGDLYINIIVEKHPIFTREGIDIISIVKVPYQRAILGCTLEAQTLAGNKTITIPELTLHGAHIIERSAGIELNDGRKGHHIFRVMYDMPKTLNADEKDLLCKIDNIKSLV